MKSSGEMYITRFERLVAEEGDQRRFEEREYAVIADADITGELKTGPFDFKMWQMGEFGPGQERWLCLQIRYPQMTEDEYQNWLESSPPPHRMSKTQRRKAFYHGGGAAEEVVALASLFLRRRLKLGPEVRIDGNPVMMERNFGVRTDKYLIEGKSNLAELRPWMELAHNLREEVHLPFVLAARLYQQALSQIQSAPDLAYLNLVSAIEALANRQKISQPIVADYDQHLAGLLERIEDRELQDRLSERILGHLNEGKIGLRFVQFILNHVEDSFWDEQSRPPEAKDETDPEKLRKWGLVVPEDLSELMQRVYAQRSKTLHEGRPFPSWALRSTRDEDLPRSPGIASGGGFWAEEDFIPYLPFMERLVRHVLITFLRRNQDQKARNADRILTAK